MFRCFCNSEKSGVGKISALRHVNDIQISGQDRDWQRRKKYHQALTVDLSAKRHTRFGVASSKHLFRAVRSIARIQNGQSSYINLESQFTDMILV